jgi:hypothetical protein
VRVRGRTVGVRIDRERVRVTVDGAVRERTLGQPLQIDLRQADTTGSINDDLR